MILGCGRQASPTPGIAGVSAVRGQLFDGFRQAVDDCAPFRNCGKPNHAPSISSNALFPQDASDFTIPWMRPDPNAEI